MPFFIIGNCINNDVFIVNHHILISGTKMSENKLIQNIKLPGRIFQLPSKGLFYKNGELADTIKNGEIHVQAMSALDEISMKNPDQLFSGDAINTVVSKCIPGILKPSELLSKDIDAIMIYLRTVTYGDSYDFYAPHCKDEHGEPITNTYVISMEQMLNEIKFIDPTTIEQNYTIELQNGQVVKLKPNKYQQVLDLIKDNQNKFVMTVEDEQQNLVKMLMAVVDSVDGEMDKEKIKEWLGIITQPMVNKIAAKVKNINTWGTDLKVKCLCKDCGEEFEVEIPINAVNFFTE
jgi:hypothetical protein